MPPLEKLNNIIIRISEKNKRLSNRFFLSWPFITEKKKTEAEKPK
jgi:hypothetical protein